MIYIQALMLMGALQLTFDWYKDGDLPAFYVSAAWALFFLMRVQ